MEIETKLNAVLVDLPRKIIEDLVIRIKTMTRNAAGGAQLGQSTYLNYRQPLIVEPSIATCRGGRVAQADRAGMEVLVAGKKPSANRFQP